MSIESSQDPVADLDKRRIRELEQRLSVSEQELLDARKRINNQDALINMMNQDIRGPLYSIMELASLAKEDKASAEKLDLYLKQASQSGASIHESLTDVIMLHHLAMHELHPVPEEIPLKDPFRKAKKEIGRFLLHNRLVFTLSDRELSDMTISADYALFSTAVQKLVKTAAYYAKRDSKIRLRVGRTPSETGFVSLLFACEFRTSRLPENAFHVLGIPVEELNMNLALDVNAADLNQLLLRALTAALGCREINVDTEDLKHCTLSFLLRFPLLEESRLKKHHFKNALKGKKILVADDDEIHLAIVERLLQEKGVTVTTVCDGAEALHIYRSEHGKFDLILMDVIMPDISGIEVTRQIRESSMIPQADTIPIVAMSVNTTREQYESGLAAGMDAYLPKPVDSDRLYRTIEKYLR